MTKPDKHNWAFPARFRSRAYGWKASSLASKRLKEAVAEVQRVARKDPVLAADGAVRLMERLWPALEAIDTSSGALGAAVSRAVTELVQVVIDAPADAPIRAQWLDRLWQAMNDDGVDYLAEVGARWGELCKIPEVAAEWVEQLLPTLRLAWSKEQKARLGGYFRGEAACLSCMVACGRYKDVLELIDAAPYVSWHLRRYGVRALVAMGRTDEAIEYAKASLSPHDPGAPVAAVCEEILLTAGRTAEAYQAWALAANQCGTHLATFRAIAEKYPNKQEAEILADLIQWSAGNEGRWFATAKTLKLFDLAADLARRSPCEPKTLNRAACDHLVDNPPFALDVALASLHWLTKGHGYEVTGADALSAFHSATQAAERLGRSDEVRSQIVTLLRKDRSDNTFVARTLNGCLYLAGHPGSAASTARIPEGDCYGAAYDTVMKLTTGCGSDTHAREDIRLVHGSVVPPEGPDAGRRINHAWVESGDKVLSDAWGRELSMDRTGFYEDTQAEVRIRYTRMEAMIALARNKHYGPWDI